MLGICMLFLVEALSIGMLYLCSWNGDEHWYAIYDILICHSCMIGVLNRHWFASMMVWLYLYMHWPGVMYIDDVCWGVDTKNVVGIKTCWLA